jgi:hypothetical protein
VGKKWLKAATYTIIVAGSLHQFIFFPEKLKGNGLRLFSFLLAEKFRAGVKALLMNSQLSSYSFL